MALEVASTRPTSRGSPQSATYMSLMCRLERHPCRLRLVRRLEPLLSSHRSLRRAAKGTREAAGEIWAWMSIGWFWGGWV